MTAPFPPQQPGPSANPPPGLPQGPAYPQGQAYPSAGFPPAGLPQGPPHPGMVPHRPAQQVGGWDNLRRKPQAVALPIVVIVLGGIVAAFFVVMFGGISVAQGHGATWLIGILFSVVVSTCGILYLRWLDRWEPEPPLLLWAAFLWGGGVALVIALVLGAPFGGIPAALQATFVAPPTEETAKGLFLVVVLLASKRGRAELNSLTDALVYAGFIGIGFSFVEDMAYIAGNKTVGEAALVTVFRGLGAFSHSIYTGMTAIGVWKGLNSTGAMRVVWPFLGWSVACLLHGLHNGSAMFGLAAVLASMAVFGLGGFLTYLIVGIRSRQHEKQTVAAQLHPMVGAGWVSPDEAQWLASLTQRRARMSLPDLPPDERRRLRGFRDDATELAFVRARLDAQVARGETPSPELLAQHDELVGLLQNSQRWVDSRLANQPRF